jgi:membrane associated rhomboid family serine protease
MFPDRLNVVEQLFLATLYVFYPFGATLFVSSWIRTGRSIELQMWAALGLHLLGLIGLALWVWCDVPFREEIRICSLAVIFVGVWLFSVSEKRREVRSQGETPGQADKV